MVRLRTLFIAASLSSCNVCFNPATVKCQEEIPPPTGPLEAIAGDNTSLSFDWPTAQDDAGIGGYRLCVGPKANLMVGCRDFSAEVCQSGLCQVTLNGVDAGFSYNQRVYAQLFGKDVCGDVAKEDAGLYVSATPINGNFNDGQGISLLSDCDGGFVADGGLLTLVHQAPLLSGCISIVTVGDDQWKNATIDVQMRVFGPTFGGVAMRVPSFDAQSQRTALLLQSGTNGTESVSLTQRPNGGLDAPVATSVSPVSDGVWREVHIAMVDAGFSVALGDLGGTPPEILRWTDPIPVQGQLGFGIVGYFFQQCTAQFQNLRVRTNAELPEGGATSQSWSFSGTGALDGVRRVGNAAAASCPGGLPEAGGCLGGTCSPMPSSQCIEIMGGGAAVVDTPIGIDFSKPWHVKVKVAMPTGVDAFNNPAFLRTTIANPAANNGIQTFAGMSLLDINGNLTQPVRVFERDPDTVGTLQRGVWNSMEMTFDAKLGTYSLTLNGATHTGGYPAGLGEHLGAIELGGGNTLHAFFTDLEIAQP
jgi:hypothetical protein